MIWKIWKISVLVIITPKETTSSSTATIVTADLLLLRRHRRRRCPPPFIHVYTLVFRIEQNHLEIVFYARD
jgi:hypothetical protein